MLVCPAGASEVSDTAATSWLTTLVVLVTSDSKLLSSCDSSSGKGVPPTELSSVVGTDDVGLVAAILAGPGIQIRAQRNESEIFVRGMRLEPSTTLSAVT